MAREVIRKENVKKYVHIPAKGKNSVSDFMGQNLPLAAMFLRNKALSWACLFFAVQTYLNEPMIKDPSDDSQPAFFRILFALVAIGTSYIDLIFPSMNGAAAAKLAAQKATEAAATAAATATA